MGSWPPQDDDWHAIQELGRDRFPDHYAGIAVPPEGIVVYRKPSAEFDEAVRALVPGVRLTLHDVAHSERELTALVHRIHEDHGYWKAMGVAVHGWGPCPELGVVHFETTDPEAARRLLPLRYGSTPPILVVEGGPAVAL